MEPLQACLPIRVVPPDKFVICLLHALLRTSEGLLQILAGAAKTCPDPVSTRAILVEKIRHPYVCLDARRQRPHAAGAYI